MQSSFSELEYAAKKKQTRRDRFLAQLEAVTPWKALVATLDPFYPKNEGPGRPTIGLERMLRMYVGTSINPIGNALLHSCIGCQPGSGDSDRRRLWPHRRNQTRARRSTFRFLPHPIRNPWLNCSSTDYQPQGNPLRIGVALQMKSEKRPAPGRAFRFPRRGRGQPQVPTAPQAVQKSQPSLRITA